MWVVGDVSSHVEMMRWIDKCEALKNKQLKDLFEWRQFSLFSYTVLWLRI